MVGVLAVLGLVLGALGVISDPCEDTYGSGWMTNSDLDGSRTCWDPDTGARVPYPG